MYTDTVTLFNRYESNLGIMWHPTVLKGVNLNMDKAAIVGRYGAESKDSAILNVKYRFVDGKKMIGNKQWLPPKEWENQVNDLLSTKITFNSDSQYPDFFYLGEWKDEVAISDSEYEKNGFYHYMNKEYDYVFAITSASFFTAIPHFEITGK